MRDEERMARLGQAVRDEARGADDAHDLARPFDAGELDAIANGAAASLGLARGEPARRRAPARWRRASTIALPLAAAAAIALFVSRPTPRAPLPAYDVAIEGGDRATRAEAPAPAAASGPVAIAPEGRLLVVARPRASVDRPVAARAAIVHDGALTMWPAPIEVSPQGAVRLVASGPVLTSVPRGASRVVLFVGDAAALPSTAEGARRALAAPPDDVRVLAADVRVDGD